MKDQLIQSLGKALDAIKADGLIPADTAINIQLSRTKDASHGDFASNIAMQLAKPAGKPPRAVAEALVAHLENDAIIEKVDIAGPGFINFFLSQDAATSVIEQIFSQGAAYGLSDYGKGKSVQVEFVSANPTGPLHVGHGRGAAYGAAVSDLLAAVGFEVTREYYVNDAGRQMNILAASVWLRYLEHCGVEFNFPANGYKGEYVKQYAYSLYAEVGEAWKVGEAEIFANVPTDEPQGGDKELHIDGLIDSAKRLLGEENYRRVFDLGLNKTLDDIRDDLAGFGITYQNWFSERSLTEDNTVDVALARLQDEGHVYEENGALWFRSTQFGDEKDRVVKRDNGQTTYFASDIAYHMNKLNRGYDRIIDVWGADHHGYVPRVRAAMEAMGGDKEKLEVLLVQFAILYRGGEKAQMSTRSGEFVTLRELREEVGKDAARYFYIMRKSEQHLDFDLDLATSQSSDNPVYYIQYAHARLCSVFRQLNEKDFAHEQGADHALLSEKHEQQLLTTLAKYPEVVLSAASQYEPHQLANFMRELANDFHTYYNAHQFLVDDAAIRNARLDLCLATQQVIRNGLSLLGLSAPEEM